MLLRKFDLTAVDEEPVTLQELKDAARIDGREFDTLLPINITAARRIAEHRTGRYLAPRTVRAELDDWPCDRLPIVPFDTVAVSYWNGTAWAVLATDKFEAVALSNGLDLCCPSTVVWPTLGDKPGARVRIDAVIPDDTADEAAVAFIIAQAVYWTQNPSAATDRKQEASPFLSHLLDACSVYG